jgi:hypothetical protein
MFCCLLAVAVLGPLGLWTVPAGKDDCCAARRRYWKALAVVMLVGIAAVGLISFLMLRAAPFQHICRFWGAA